MCALGGLLESTVGSADLHFATALLGPGPSSDSVPPGMHPAYAHAVSAQQQRAAALGLTLGAVPGDIAHSWHGSMTQRRYVERWNMLISWGFRPDFIARGPGGMLAWTPFAPEGLKAAVYAYFVGRREDDVVVLDADRRQYGDGGARGAQQQQQQQQAGMMYVMQAPAAPQHHGLGATLRAGVGAAARRMAAASHGIHFGSGPDSWSSS